MARGKVKQSGCTVSAARLLCVRKLYLLTPSIHDIIASGWLKVMISKAQRNCAVVETGGQSPPRSVRVAATKDRSFVERESARLDALLEGKSELKEEVYKLVVEKL